MNLDLTPEVEAGIRTVLERAAAAPVEITTLAERLASPGGKEAHMEQMSDQTLVLEDLGIMFTLSIETGHPCGPCRHLSYSYPRELSRGRKLRSEVVDAFLVKFGFHGGQAGCMAIWPELMQHRGLAVNLVQPIAPQSSPASAT